MELFFDLPHVQEDLRFFVLHRSSISSGVWILIGGTVAQVDLVNAFDSPEVRQVLHVPSYQTIYPI